jgi:hypothetical protein
MTATISIQQTAEDRFGVEAGKAISVASMIIIAIILYVLFKQKDWI